MRCVAIICQGIGVNGWNTVYWANLCIKCFRTLRRIRYWRLRNGQSALDRRVQLTDLTCGSLRDRRVDHPPAQAQKPSLERFTCLCNSK